MARIDTAKQALEHTKATMKNWPLASYLINKQGIYKKGSVSDDSVRTPKCWRKVELTLDDRMHPVLNHVAEGTCDLEWVEVLIHEVEKGKHDNLPLLEREVVINPMYKVGRRP